MRTTWVRLGILGIALCVIGGLAVWIWQRPLQSMLADDVPLWQVAAALCATVMAALVIGLWISGSLGREAFTREAGLPEESEASARESASGPDPAWIGAIEVHMRQQHGRFWRRKVKLLLVAGEMTQVEMVVPGLVTRHWLAGQNALLLWTGDPQRSLDQLAVNKWKPLLRRRGPDGFVWILSREQICEGKAVSLGNQHLRGFADRLGWELPLHLWHVVVSEWPQVGLRVQPVGCLLPSKATDSTVAEGLQRLDAPLREVGLAQVGGDMSHDFLLRLGLDLRKTLISPLKAASRELCAGRGIALSGIWFSLAGVQQPLPGNQWSADPAWQAILDDRRPRARRLGWSLGRTAYVATLGICALGSAGLLLSYATNRQAITRADAALATLHQATPDTEPLRALGPLVDELARLNYQVEHGAPWYQRFGLDRSQRLRDRLWPQYVQANQRLLLAPAAAQLEGELRALLKLAPNSPERAERANAAYDTLKTYLMLAHPDKADPAFLLQTLGTTTPDLWSFFTEQLPANPAWAIAADEQLIAQVRRVLLRQLGRRNGETALYQQVLASAANHYPALGLEGMVGETDAAALFTSKVTVPGVFTREAWEGQVRDAIEAAAKARREKIDWVLSDQPGELAGDLNPERLRERLTARYFRDYAGAWLTFANSLRWQRRHSLDQVIEQLALMSDARRSPLIALTHTLAYQGQAGIRSQALADTLIESAQSLMAKRKAPLAEPLPQIPSGPLHPTFGPLLALLGKGAEPQRGDDLSLQVFLTRVTSVRLKLQQVTSASDPQAMTQAMAQTVFQGKGIDLTATQAYGSLIAASLGSEWHGAAQALFVQPLEQAWQRVLQPSAAGLNREWQRSIVEEWNSAFAGRYPFAATASDASLPMLGQMIRSDSGRIDRFLYGQLAGLLRKEGSRWVIDPRASQGLRFDPAFLQAINQLGALADVLYTDGGMGLGFELRAKAVRDVVQTTFIFDGQKHHYFNQPESWQRFRWPGQGEYPGTRLTWTSVYTGERLFADLSGNWGLIRLLEQAQVTPLDDGDSRFRVVITAPDGIGLTWHLRTELGKGPLALLDLRGFELPRRVFVVEGT